MVDGSAEKLNFILASVGKRRVQEKGGRWLARTAAQLGNRIKGKRAKDRKREDERT